MHDLVIYLPQVLVPAGTLAALLLLLRQERARRELAAALVLERDERTRLERDVRALLSCSQNLLDRLRDQGKKQVTLSRQLHSLEKQDDDDLAVTHAAKLLEKGIALDEIARICELTHGEVELLSRLSKHRRAA